MVVWDACLYTYAIYIYTHTVGERALCFGGLVRPHTLPPPPPSPSGGGAWIQVRVWSLPSCPVVKETLGSSPAAVEAGDTVVERRRRGRCRSQAVKDPRWTVEMVGASKPNWQGSQGRKSQGIASREEECGRKEKGKKINKEPFMPSLQTDSVILRYHSR